MRSVLLTGIIESSSLSGLLPGFPRAGGGMRLVGRLFEYYYHHAKLNKRAGNNAVFYARQERQ